jgi:hypothetical protein
MFNSLVVPIIKKTRHIFLPLNLPILICSSINQSSLIYLQSFLSDVDLCYLVELSVKSSCLHPLFRSAFTHYPLFQWYPQSKEVLLNLSMKCWNSAFNLQGSRLIIVIVQVGAVKIYVAAMEALRKKERQHETQFTTKISGKTSLGPSYFVL